LWRRPSEHVLRGLRVVLTKRGRDVMRAGAGQLMPSVAVLRRRLRQLGMRAVLCRRRPRKVVDRRLLVCRGRMDPVVRVGAGVRRPRVGWVRIPVRGAGGLVGIS
jgi:hypothetical protein